MKQLKRPILVLLVLMCLSSIACAESIGKGMPSTRPQEGIKPLYDYTTSITAVLTFSNGKANCYGTLTPSGNEDVTISVTLYKKNGSSWGYVTSWSGSSTGGRTASAGGSVSVERGTYKVVTSGNVGGFEYPTKTVKKTY